MTIRLLVATARGQGRRDNDFHWAAEGEPVRLASMCDSDRRSPDSRCGCGRAFVGLDTSRSTSTTRVAELDLTVEDYARRLFEDQNLFTLDECREDAEDLIRAVRDFPVGMVVERRGNTLQERRVVSAHYRVTSLVVREIPGCGDHDDALRAAHTELLEHGWLLPRRTHRVHDVAPHPRPGPGAARPYAVVTTVAREIDGDGPRHALELENAALRELGWTPTTRRGDTSRVKGIRRRPAATPTAGRS
ncbi:hypothetical protein [Saccharothrix sp. HUAS TT1]|uniref:DUF7715 family protein n=1 Tax=unclassified Saccharothrix TaxID=2593673 RepID=UPI00345C4FA7